MSKWAWCLVKDDNTLAIGWNQVGDYWYYMYANGSMACDEWLQLSGIWYKVNDKGQMITGWWQDPNTQKWYYLEEQSNGHKGEMYINGTFTINGKSYSFDSTGAWVEIQDLLSDDGAKFIGSWEGFYSQAYEDPYYPGNQNWWTIGYGTTYAVTPEAFSNGLNSTCTEEQAIGWLKDEAQACAQTIKSDLDSKSVSLNQNQLDALISFAYNCGANALLSSTLYKNIVAGIRDANTITSNFQAWSNANGQRSDGLYKRRTSEANLFLNSDYTGNV